MINKLKGRRKKKLFERYEGDFRFTTVEEVNGLIEEANEDIEELTASISGLAPAANYKKYTAIISQTSTNAPSAIVLENELGGAIVWTRNSTGTYTGTLTGAFTVDKTWFSVSMPSPTTSGVLMFFARLNNNSIALATRDFAGTLVDGFGATSIEIRVYN